jgi:DNA-binding transcriptional LysR family regulator
MTIRPTARTIRIEDMALFARIAEVKSFTVAGRRLGIPKQTLSRRIARLESALGAQLLHRTTRRMELTDVGAAYASQCAEVVRIADEANKALTDTRPQPTGVLRVTADPLFGDVFLAPLIIDYARRWPEMQVEVLLTSRRVDLVEEGFDVAFRVGLVDDKRLTAIRLGPARVRYCASPKYVREHGSPTSARELGAHECLVVRAEGEPARWPVPGKKGVTLIPVTGRLRMSSVAMTYAAALGGLGIGLFPDFLCGKDLQRGRLVTVLDPNGVDVGAVWLVHPLQRYLAQRVRAFVELAAERLGGGPWASPVVGAAR